MTQEDIKVITDTLISYSNQLKGLRKDVLDLQADVTSLKYKIDYLRGRNL